MTVGSITDTSAIVTYDVKMNSEEMIDLAIWRDYDNHEMASIDVSADVTGASWDLDDALDPEEDYTVMLASVFTGSLVHTPLAQFTTLAAVPAAPTKADLQQALTEKGIEYPKKATNKELEELLKGAEAEAL